MIAVGEINTLLLGPIGAAAGLGLRPVRGERAAVARLRDFWL